MTCPICKDTTAELTTERIASVNCSQCGDYAINQAAIARLAHGSLDEFRWKISAWRHQYPPEILTCDDIQTAIISKVPSLQHRAERMLRQLYLRYSVELEYRFHEIGGILYADTRTITHSFVQNFDVSSQLMQIGWNKSFNEMQYMLKNLLCDELKFLIFNDGYYQISPKGLLHLEGRKEDQSSIGFCAMWFSPEVLPLWTDVIEPATRAAGYEPLRIDDKQHNGKIDDEIMASIRSSRFVVSDFTGNRGGVYYEAGFAHGLGLPVIFMCREGDDLHFDVKQYNCIFWKTGELTEARERLKNRILATLGQGPLKIQ